jgi:hypothetical protein
MTSWGKTICNAGFLLETTLRVLNLNWHSNYNGTDMETCHIDTNMIDTQQIESRNIL